MITKPNPLSEHPEPALQRRLDIIIFDTGTLAGRRFDMTLIAAILLSIYWAMVTITTVGYGDLVPQTAAGRFVAGFGMLVGYSIIAVPTAIITRKLWERINEQRAAQPTLPWNCPVCAKQGHALAALFCQHCGAELDVPSDIRERAQRDA